MRNIENSKLNRLPVSFEIKNEFSSEDTRFLNITIDVMHLGRNLNNSSFSREVVEEAIPSIFNTPILGYIHKVNGELDFKGHESQIVITEDSIEEQYLCQAFGCVPESGNPRFITKITQQGQKLEFLQVDAILWTKFTDAVEIFERDGEKSQSMELELSSIEGSIGDDGSFIFKHFKFDGCCLLGENISPAMISAKAVANFSVESVSEQIKEKLNQYTAFTNLQSNTCDTNSADNSCAMGNSVAEIEYNNNSEEGGMSNMDEKNEILAKYSVTAESIDFVETEMTLEEFEAKVKEFSEANADKGDTGENGDSGDSNFSTDEPNSTTEPATDFALEGQFEDELRESLGSVKMIESWGSESFETRRYWFCDYDKSIQQVYAFDNEDWKLYGFKYEVSGDKVTVDFNSKTRKKYEIVDFEDGAADPAMGMFKQLVDGVVTFGNEKVKTVQDSLDDINGKYAALVAEIDTQSKAQELETKQEFVAQFEKELSDVAEFTELKGDLDKFTVDEIEIKCFAMVGKKKANFSIEKNSKPQIPKIVVEKSDTKPVPDVPYAHRFM